MKKLSSVLSTETLASVIEYSEHITEYIDELSIRKKIDILSQIEAADAAVYLKQTDKGNRKTILDLMDSEVKAGGSIKEAMTALVTQAAENDNITTLYVVEEDNTLLGAIDLKDFITAREGTALDDITMTSYPYVYANELIEDCIVKIRDYSEDSIPVLDADNKLKGVLIS